MAGISELGFPSANTSVVNMKHRLVITTLRNVRSQGHIYVEVREDGKKLVFFCTLCLAQCHSDTILFDHLKGKQHNERLVTAKATLLKPNPWPFSDGVFFFKDDPQEQRKSLSDSKSKQVNLSDTLHMPESSLAIVSYENSGGDAGAHKLQEVEGNGSGDNTAVQSNVDGQGNSGELVVPAVLQKDVVSDLSATHIGVGVIGARCIKKDGLPDEIHRIWCEWLGNRNSDMGDVGLVEEHDFAVITFSYDCNLGRMGLLDCFKLLLPSSPHSEAEDSIGARCKKRKRKSLSDPGDLSNQNESSGEDSQSSNGLNGKASVPGSDDQLVRERILASKSMRKQLREQQRVASERLCAICRQKMLPHQDVAALLNRKTGKLVCSSRNFTGAFHVFHISCLLHWVLICEVESFINQPIQAKPKRRSRRKTKRKTVEAVENHQMQEIKKQIDSVLCPECQGTGIPVDKDLEKPCIPLAEIYRCKIKLCDAHKAWMKSPEVLEHCSMGFTFPLQSDEIYEETLASRKLLHFYRANG